VVKSIALVSEGSRYGHPQRPGCQLRVGADGNRARGGGASGSGTATFTAEQVVLQNSLGGAFNQATAPAPVSGTALAINAIGLAVAAELSEPPGWSRWEPP
jgi:hypothetical protein